MRTPQPTFLIRADTAVAVDALPEVIVCCDPHMSCADLWRHLCDWRADASPTDATTFRVAFVVAPVAIGDAPESIDAPEIDDAPESADALESTDAPCVLLLLHSQEIPADMVLWTKFLKSTEYSVHAWFTDADDVVERFVGGVFAEVRRSRRLWIPALIKARKAATADGEPPSSVIANWLNAMFVCTGTLLRDDLYTRGKWFMYEGEFHHALADWAKLDLTQYDVADVAFHKVWLSVQSSAKADATRWLAVLLREIPEEPRPIEVAWMESMVCALTGKLARALHLLSAYDLEQPEYEAYRAVVQLRRVIVENQIGSDDATREHRLRLALVWFSRDYHFEGVSTCQRELAKLLREGAESSCTNALKYADAAVETAMTYFAPARMTYFNALSTMGYLYGAAAYELDSEHDALARELIAHSIVAYMRALKVANKQYKAAIQFQVGLQLQECADRTEDPAIARKHLEQAAYMFRECLKLRNERWATAPEVSAAGQDVAVAKVKLGAVLLRLHGSRSPEARQELRDAKTLLTTLGTPKLQDVLNDVDELLSQLD